MKAALCITPGLFIALLCRFTGGQWCPTGQNVGHTLRCSVRSGLFHEHAQQEAVDAIWDVPYSVASVVLLGAK
jgi:hypothetical protein